MSKPSTSILLKITTLAALTALGSSALLSDSIAVKAIPIGNAAWLYPENMQQVANWTQLITNYNLAAGLQRAIRALYVYSMDLDISMTKPVIGSITEAAAAAFRSIPYISHVAGTVDGVLSDTANLNRLSSAKLNALADAYALRYCNSTLDGIHLDLEPYSAAYKTNVNAFLQRLSRGLRDTTCRNATLGKSLSFFVGPRQADAALYRALGANGYAVISGYDLDCPGPNLLESPAQYKTNLLSNVRAVIAAANSSANARFSIGLPFAASACEYTTATSVANPSQVITGYPMYDATRPSYIPAAFEVLNQTLGVTATRRQSSFLGVSMWAWLSRDVVVGGFRRAPKNAFDTPGMATYLKDNMPWKDL